MNPEHARAFFRKVYGSEPDVVGSAPGRVNVIGEHTDYNGGQVLPIAIDRRTYVAVRAKPDSSTSCIASEHEASRGAFDMRSISRSGSWWDYVTGVCAGFVGAGSCLPQIDAAVISDVPAGSGLSSSAALELATSLAVAALIGDGRTLKDLALLSWRVENEFVGVACGVMDQFASALCDRDSALHLWCDTLETEQVPLTESLLIFDTAIPRSLRSSQFNQRRAECEQALSLLRKTNPSLPNLASADPGEVRKARLPETLEARALHVTEETRRVTAVVSGLKDRGLVDGALLYASHESLRTKYDCSSPELDWFVDQARATPGVTGARLTGAGWGGCAIAVGKYDALAAATEALCANYEARFHRKPRTWLTRAGEGARLEVPA
ncbi:MAG: galactokinase [Gemmatimonadaceae bacterium]